ncbi:glucokinase [Synechococcus sp. PCC 7335]|uniref:glucokinase n=1 Tax=Synechococcus sp. (strain ATCC 29403 / PCC 7335) TaxID=91464 RepID=UPI00017EE7D8|nr:glucokinase [Synechococcus sp. PCC 7335]EDX83814.1 glucokinase [Synechococcus sp. PCC 7335]
MPILLAGDVGGTKTILRLVEFSPPIKLQSQSLPVDALYEKTYVSASFSDLHLMVEEFLVEAGTQLGSAPSIKVACFGIAGPVVERRSELTNLGWSLNADLLETKLNIPTVALLNDFEANGYGVLGLEPSELSTLQTAVPHPKYPIAVIGAGTGLGEGFLIPENGCYEVFPGEGGHADFAPQTSEEYGLCQYLQKRDRLSHVSIERVVSGIGIVSIYQYLRDEVKLAPESEEVSAAFDAWRKGKETHTHPQSPAAAISKHAMLSQDVSTNTGEDNTDKKDILCERALEMFVQLYGSEAGNLALKILPYGGLYITGGIAAKILPLMKKGDFLEAFLNKGRVSTLLKKVPIHVVLNPKVGLIGAALYAARLGSM